MISPPVLWLFLVLCSVCTTFVVSSDETTSTEFIGNPAENVQEPATKHTTKITEAIPDATTFLRHETLKGCTKASADSIKILVFKHAIWKYILACVTATYTVV